MINPTGGVIRNDSQGQGHYRAWRGRRLHKGVDYVATPGQMVKAPISGEITRKIQVYRGSKKWVGLEIVGDRATVQLYYVEPNPDIIGTYTVAGRFIGEAQDIRQKYGPEMIAHVHLQIVALDPECLMEV